MLHATLKSWEWALRLHVVASLGMPGRGYIYAIRDMRYACLQRAQFELSRDHIKNWKHGYGCVWIDGQVMLEISGKGFVRTSRR